MSDRPYRPDDGSDDLDVTQRGSSPTQRVPIPPPPTEGRGHVRMTNDRYGSSERPRPRTSDYTVPTPAVDEPPSGAAVRRAQRRVRRKSDSGLFLPAWSVAAMLVVVLAVAAGIIFIVVSLGGGVASSGEPRVMIITAIPSETPAVAAQPDALPTLPANNAVALNATAEDPNALPTFALEGPVLPTIVLTQPPLDIGVGTRVVVINVGASRLNVRESPGTGASILFQADVNDEFDVIGGPETTSSSGNTLTWWQLRNVSNPGQTGWAVDNDGQQDVLEVMQP